MGSNKKTYEYGGEVIYEGKYYSIYLDSVTVKKDKDGKVTVSVEARKKNTSDVNYIWGEIWKPAEEDIPYLPYFNAGDEQRLEETFTLGSATSVDWTLEEMEAWHVLGIDSYRLFNDSATIKVDISGDKPVVTANVMNLE